VFTYTYNDQMIPVRVLAALALAASALPAQDRPAIFRITPARPVAELRAEAIAATPPTEAGPFRPADLVDLARLDSRIKLEIRYATRDNFLSTPVYTQARAFLQRPAAEALLRAHRALLQQGYGLLIFDAYRPWFVTTMRKFGSSFERLGDDLHCECPDFATNGCVAAATAEEPTPIPVRVCRAAFRAHVAHVAPWRGETAGARAQRPRLFLPEGLGGFWGYPAW
jgi:hypothetical protein